MSGWVETGEAAAYFSVCCSCVKLGDGSCSGLVLEELNKMENLSLHISNLCYGTIHLTQ